MALETVAGYLRDARVLLQDTREPYRYDDWQIKQAIGFGQLEMRRLRPDLFPTGELTEVEWNTADATAVDVDKQYRMALLYYVVGHVMLREEEESTQQIARAYKQQFGAQLVSIAV
jgi:hypothetical protein